MLRPSEKSRKYALELKKGYHITNFGKPKTDAEGCVYGLSNTQQAYRSGYLDARKDITKVYNYHNRQKKK